MLIAFLHLHDQIHQLKTGLVKFGWIYISFVSTDQYIIGRIKIYSCWRLHDCDSDVNSARLVTTYKYFNAHMLPTEAMAYFNVFDDYFYITFFLSSHVDVSCLRN